MGLVIAHPHLYQGLGARVLRMTLQKDPKPCVVSRWRSGKESACQRKRCRRLRFNPLVGKIPWWRKWQPTPVFLPDESHGQRTLAVYAIQPSHPLSSPSPPALNLSQHQGLFQLVSSSHQVAKVLEFQLSASVLPMNIQD